MPEKQAWYKNRSAIFALVAIALTTFEALSRWLSEYTDGGIAVGVIGVVTFVLGLFSDRPGEASG